MASITDHPGRDAGGDVIFRHVACHHGPRSDHRIAADSRPIGHHDVRPEPDVLSYLDAARRPALV
jgi:hypothetical protein